ncbi:MULTISPECIES: NAD(P)H-dependent flavin oxidoreductase [Bacillales]|uniref:NAD(P)H-dependent flavin oxidoreductase n=1 Tax=Bacillales TaxID=1385 RepID=UPI001884331D|nr:nitronate monooxygenase [Pseudalkalibacillus hwajinpoensis]MBF0707134.1 nitronate monooxygenase [Pseudalkalibacillus hwajinpoensis]
MKRVCQLFSIRYPIIQGGMGNISSPILASAVSEAGGLGTIGTGTLSLEEVESLLLDMKQRTAKPFALNIPITVTTDLKGMCELAVKHAVPIVSLSAGNPAPYVPFLKECGIKVICVTASVKQAKKAEESGADLIVGEGYEAAGINSPLEITTMTLIPQLVASVQIPVIAAGGIGDARGFAAALALGAEGVQMGTRLIATEESPYHERYLTKLLEANDTETVIVGRSVGKVRRVLRTEYADQLLKAELSGVKPEDFAAMTDEEKHRIGAVEGRLGDGFINGGQISGIVKSIPSVQKLFEDMVEGALLIYKNKLEEFEKISMKK